MNEKTPERIYGWLDSHLSIARFSGGCKFNGAKYVIAYDEEGQPLVRADLMRKKKRKKVIETELAQLDFSERLK